MENRRFSPKTEVKLFQRINQTISQFLKPHKNLKTPKTEISGDNLGFYSGGPFYDAFLNAIKFDIFPGPPLWIVISLFSLITHIILETY